ncbi:MAG: 50S ribosomal protein L6, partial [Candidatus ainarchaeum sp.]|nr:50S ribosomal protein L6 [Candidatus ainarchaeum sp.]
MVSENFVEKIALPAGCHASLEGEWLKIKGAKAELRKKIPSRRLKVRVEGNSVVLEIASKKKTDYACLRSFEKHIGNLVKGTEKEFEYHLRVVYSHFPINIAVKG